MGLLTGYRVVEVSLLLNGASTSMMLADLGAEVIKLESPRLGDYLRIDETRYLHLQANRNKRSICLDLATSGGQEVLGALIGTADVFVTNATGNRNAKLGLSYEQLKALREDIIYCQNTGFGATGPYADLPVHGQMMDALAGARPVMMGGDGLTAGRFAFTGRACRSAARARRRSNLRGVPYRGRPGASRGTAAAATSDVAAATAVTANAWTAVSALPNQPEVAAVADPAQRRAPATSTRRPIKFVLFSPRGARSGLAFCFTTGREDPLPGYGEDLAAGPAIMHTRPWPSGCRWRTTTGRRRSACQPIDEVPTTRRSPPAACSCPAATPTAAR
jgi:formyl-CoA transferase